MSGIIDLWLRPTSCQKTTKNKTQRTIGVLLVCQQSTKSWHQFWQTDLMSIWIGNRNSLQLSEQKGCRMGSNIWKDKWMIDKMILVKQSKRTYRPHGHTTKRHSIVCSMELYKRCLTITNFITQNMKAWGTTLIINHGDDNITWRPIEIKSGIFREDSLSPLLLCLSLAPLNSLVIYLLYVDDLNTFAKNYEQQADVCAQLRILEMASECTSATDDCHSGNWNWMIVQVPWH